MKTSRQGLAAQGKVFQPGGRHLLPFESPAAAGKGDSRPGHVMGESFGHRQCRKQMAAGPAAGQDDV